VEAVQQLLELGAHPNAHGADCCSRAAIGWVWFRPSWEAGNPRLAIAQQLLQHGADCLLPLSRHAHSTSILGYFAPMCPLEGIPQEGPSRDGIRLADLMLAGLDQQRAAGTLHLGSTWAAAEAAMAALQRSHLPLLAHALNSLRAQLQQQPGGSIGGLAAEGTELLCRVLVCALSAKRSRAASQLVLSSGLPFALAFASGSSRFRPMLVDYTIAGGLPAATLPLLLHMGAQLTARDVLWAVSKGTPPAVQALMSCHSMLPEVPADLIFMARPGRDEAVGWACPIHCALFNAVRASGLLAWAAVGVLAVWP